MYTIFTLRTYVQVAAHQNARGHHARRKALHVYIHTSNTYIRVVASSIAEIKAGVVDNYGTCVVVDQTIPFKVCAHY